MNQYEDMGESPLHEERDTRFQPGVSGNPAGRPKGSGKKNPRSKMRTQLAKLCELQPDALEILRISMTGKNSDGQPATMTKEKVDMAKFVVNKIESLNNTCLREEMAILGVRDKGNDEGAKQLEENQSAEATATGAFSMDLENQTFN
jgi:hypothetical protein